jgi:hypothetical protein
MVFIIGLAARILDPRRWITSSGMNDIEGQAKVADYVCCMSILESVLGHLDFRGWLG